MVTCLLLTTCRFPCQIPWSLACRCLCACSLNCWPGAACLKASLLALQLARVLASMLLSLPFSRSVGQLTSPACPCHRPTPCDRTVCSGRRTNGCLCVCTNTRTRAHARCVQEVLLPWLRLFDEAAPLGDPHASPLVLPQGLHVRRTTQDALNYHLARRCVAHTLLLMVPLHHACSCACPHTPTCMARAHTHTHTHTCLRPLTSSNSWSRHVCSFAAAAHARAHPALAPAGATFGGLHEQPQALSYEDLLPLHHKGVLGGAIMVACMSSLRP